MNSIRRAKAAQQGFTLVEILAVKGEQPKPKRRRPSFRKPGEEAAEEIRTFLREFHPPRMRPRLSLTNLRALLHSSIRLGILGRERFHYWGLIVWTLLRRPALLQTAITLAIYGHHFRRTCRSIGP